MHGQTKSITELNEDNHLRAEECFWVSSIVFPEGLISELGVQGVRL